MKYRDPLTGELKEVTVKASDTLPIGTIVEYDGDEVPAGWEQIEDEDEYVLYDDMTGSNEEITLSDSAANYKKLEIFYGNVAKTGCMSGKVYNPNGKGFDMQAMVTASSNNLYINTCRVSINGNKITPISYGSNQIQTDNISLNNETNSIYIYRVEGYK